MESAKNQTEDVWAKFHEAALPYEQAIRHEPLYTLIENIAQFLRHHKRDYVFEAGFGTGYAMVALATMGFEAQGCEISKELIKRADKLANDMGVPIFTLEANVFDIMGYAENGSAPVMYHQGLLEHFTNGKIQQLLHLQVENSFAVIFSVPSFFYGRQDFGDERLLTLEQWQEILIPFDLMKLVYYDTKRHILGIIKGKHFKPR